MRSLLPPCRKRCKRKFVRRFKGCQIKDRNHHSHKRRNQQNKIVAWHSNRAKSRRLPVYRWKGKARKKKNLPALHRIAEAKRKKVRRVATLPARPCLRP